VRHAVIAGYVRSPFTPAFKGGLALTRADDLAATVVKALVKRTGINPNDIEDLKLGCAFPEGEQGLNLARLVVFLAGLPVAVGGVTSTAFAALPCRLFMMPQGLLPVVPVMFLSALVLKA